MKNSAATSVNVVRLFEEERAVLDRRLVRAPLEEADDDVTSTMAGALAILSRFSRMIWGYLSSVVSFLSIASRASSRAPAANAVRATWR